LSSRRPPSIASSKVVRAPAPLPERHCVPQAQQQLAAPLTGYVPHQSEQLERAPVVDGSLLVREQGSSPIAGPDQVFQCLVRVPERRRQIQVARDLGKMRIEILAVHALEQATHFTVELEPPGRRKIVIERLPHELVREGVTVRRGGKLGDDAQRHCVVNHVEEPSRGQPAPALEQVQIELAPEDGSDPENRHRLTGQGGHAAADQRANLLRHASERVRARRVEALQGVLGSEKPDDLSQEEGIALGDLVQPHDEMARRPRSDEGRDVVVHVCRGQAAKRDPPSDSGELGEDVAQLAYPLLRLSVGSDEHDARLGERVAQEPQEQQRRLVRGVNIVKRYEERPIRGDGREEAADRVE
jgi:hypothetical protein